MTIANRLRAKKQPKQLYKRLLGRHLKRSRRRYIRYSLLSANIVLLIGAIYFVSSHTDIPGQSGASGALLSSDARGANYNPLDQLSSADIAVHLARMAQLEVATAVVNQADTANAQFTMTSADEPVAIKPQVVSTNLKTKQDIVTYTVKEGDTISSVAEAHGVTSDSIRWSNDLSRETLEPGQQVLVPPVNGIVYVVRDGDTPDSLAIRYSANKEQLVAFNDAEIDGLIVGDKIVIPDGVRPAPRPVFSHSYPGNASYGITPQYRGNGYIYGWCTWHAANRRAEIGRPIPSNLGNAISWYSLSQRSGLATGSKPKAGAVVWHANMGGLGHVAFVEKINKDGSALVSDMNYPSWGRVTYRTVTPAEFSAYRFIY